MLNILTKPARGAAVSIFGGHTIYRAANVVA